MTIPVAGAAVGLRPAGYHALNSLRMEKAYRGWGHDISAGDTPLEAGLGFAVAWDKPGGFRGRDALVAERTVTVADWIAELATHSPIMLLERRVQDQLLSDLAVHVHSDVGDPVHIVHETHALRARRRDDRRGP